MIEKVLRKMIAAFAFIACVSSPALAGGSISLTEVLANFDAPPDLVATLDAAISDAGIAADDVICSGARFGRHWTHLGGGRASPYECPIGGRTLVISGRHEYRDEAGKVLDENIADIHEKAAVHRDVDVTWAWQ